MNDTQTPCKVVLPVPTDVSDRVRQEAKRSLARRCGGYTSHQADGGWVAPDGQLIEENVEVITAVIKDGHPPTVAKGVADLVATQSQESEVMWWLEPIQAVGTVEK